VHGHDSVGEQQRRLRHAHLEQVLVLRRESLAEELGDAARGVHQQLGAGKAERGRLRWNRNDGLGSAQLAAGARAHQGLDGELAQVQKAALQLRLRLEVLAVDGSHCAVHSRLLKGKVRSAIAEL